MSWLDLRTIHAFLHKGLEKLRAAPLTMTCPLCDKEYWYCAKHRGATQHRAAVLRHIQVCSAISCMTEFYEYILVAREENLSFPKGIVSISQCLTPDKHLCPSCKNEFYQQEPNQFPKPISRVMNDISVFYLQAGRMSLFLRIPDQIASRVALAHLLPARPRVMRSEVPLSAPRPRIQNKKYVRPRVQEILEETLTEDNIEALKERVQQCEKEITILKSASDALMVKCLCVICMENERSRVTLPCSHLVLCGTCAPRVSSCPICSEKVTLHNQCYWI